MKFVFAAALITGMVFGQARALATSFTFTTEGRGSMGFIDTDTASVTGGIGKATTYSVFRTDEPVPKAAKIPGPSSKYAARAAEVWFECTTRHYSLVRLFFYDSSGILTGSFDNPVLVDQPVPPQTGVEEQFKIICEKAPLKNSISKFNELETPLQTLIRTARATLNDPRYLP